MLRRVHCNAADSGYLWQVRLRCRPALVRSFISDPFDRNSALNLNGEPRMHPSLHPARPSQSADARKPDASRTHGRSAYGSRQSLGETQRCPSVRRRQPRRDWTCKGFLQRYTSSRSCSWRVPKAHSIADARLLTADVPARDGLLPHAAGAPTPSDEAAPYRGIVQPFAPRGVSRSRSEGRLVERPAYSGPWSLGCRSFLGSLVMVPCNNRRFELEDPQLEGRSVWRQHLLTPWVARRGAAKKRTQRPATAIGRYQPFALTGQGTQSSELRRPASTSDGP